MNKCLAFVLFIVITQVTLAQQTTQAILDTTAIDNQYREDQFYVAVTYNLLANKPSGLSQSGFSSGFHLGFIRDLPINKMRNMAFGIGIGLSSNSYNQNLLILKDDDNKFGYSILDENDVSFTKNKFTTYLVEMPFEFRWRRSTPTEYKFWRIYTGFKLGYVIANSSKFIGSLGDKTYSNIKDINDFQYGLTLGAGYGTWNFHLYYGLNSIFNSDAKIENENVDLKSVRIGLILYIL